MKKYLLLLVSLIVSAVAVSAGPRDKYTIDREQLPVEARNFLSTHFPKTKVGMIKVDRHLLKKTDYDVRLTNGTEVDFDNAGVWKSVDCKTREVPSAIVPKSIRNYVAKNFQDVFIVSIEKKSSGGYEVELSDGVELKFNALGQFKSMEMD